jgi:hypothetical protein
MTKADNIKKIKSSADKNFKGAVRKVFTWFMDWNFSDDGYLANSYINEWVERFKNGTYFQSSHPSIREFFKEDYVVRALLCDHCVHKLNALTHKRCTMHEFDTSSIHACKNYKRTI